MANKVDPRVDSDRIGGNTTGAGGYGTGHSTGLTGGNTHSTGLGGNTHSTGLTGGSNTHGTGHSGLTGNTHATGHNTHGTLHGNLPGPADNTAGPHKSDMLNKMDPTVDSDLDGSKTVGGNNTYNR